MKIYGTGVDIVNIDRISSVYVKYGERFLRRILSDTEQKEFFATGEKTSYLAKHFAAKEAVAKALGIGINNGLSFSAIKIQHTTHGKPRVDIQFPTSLQNKYADLDISLSISDEQEYAVAFALAASL